MKPNVIVLSLILTLAFFIRFINLGSNPPGLTWDEAALGYNAYSILLTGRDEYGAFLPFNLQSFGDYKPALYAYLDIPFIVIFGLNEFAVRIPSAIVGTLNVLTVFLLVRLLFKNNILASLSAFFVAVSPFAIQFSRPAFEANLALFLNLLATYIFLKAKSMRLIILSMVLFSLSLVTYQSSRIFTPLLVIALFILHRKEVSSKKLVSAGGLFLTIFVLIMVSTFVLGQGKRLSTLNFFAYQRSEDEIKVITNEDGLAVDSSGFQILHGEWWAYTRGLFERYFIYLSPKMLAIDGDYNQRHRVPDLGVIYYFSVVLIPLGIAYFLKLGGSGSRLLFIWLLLAPIPAVLSRDLINLLRALNLMIPLEILQAGGFMLLVSWFKKRKILLIIFLTISISVFVVNFILYLDRYFIHSPIEYSKYWSYGYKPAMEILANQVKDKKYGHIVMTDFYNQPYIYYLFYTRYPPDKYQAQAKLEQNGVDVGVVRKVDNIEFRHVFWPSDRGFKNSLFIGTLDELPDQDTKPFPEYKIISDIKFLDGKPALRVVESR